MCIRDSFCAGEFIRLPAWIFTEHNKMLNLNFLDDLFSKVRSQPLVLAGQILSLSADILAQPFYAFGVIDIIVVDPSLVSCVVGRVDVDTLYPRCV